jgi:hypothetical protein
LWTGAIEAYRDTGFVAIAADVEYDELCGRRCRCLEPAKLRATLDANGWMQTERAETTMTRSHRTQFGESHQPQGVR